ncbi:MAG: TIGR00289 family protein [Candidatus Nitrosocaldaceae archaeon]|nr:MAG: TIGR00289 family protein [Candidatus Nitrosocaldaceae archaeon]
MKLGILYSGGKDSNFAVYNALNEGHEVRLLISIIPDNEESMLFHYPNIVHTKAQADSMNIPILQYRINADSIEEELKGLEEALEDAKRYGITDISSGGISSRFQNERFISICKRLGLGYHAPLWNMDQIEYMHKLLELEFEIMIVGVSAYGLDERWLGRVLDKEGLDEIISLSKKYGFNPAFEGGEAETFVLDMPYFNYRLVAEGEKYWDGIRGIFKITKLRKVKKIF